MSVTSRGQETLCTDREMYKALTNKDVNTPFVGGRQKRKDLSRTRTGREQSWSCRALKQWQQIQILKTFFNTLIAICTL
jgi:hypothetical protein